MKVKVKAKLAKLRRELLTPTSKGGGGGGGEGFNVTKRGDARVGLVGFPSVGKSTLLNKLTGTFSEVASYEFTTLTCIPGVITYRGAKIQLLDLPGIIEGAKDGKGRGRQVISTARTCNCILIVLDAIKPITHKRLIEKELEGFGIRLNKEPLNLTFRKKEKGGINFTSTVANTHLDLETVKAICSEYKIHNADVTLRFDATADDLIDVIEVQNTSRKELASEYRKPIHGTALLSRFSLHAYFFPALNLLSLSSHPFLYVFLHATFSLLFESSRSL
ncbi:hypothetical protein L1987_45611 [Smallanthus sonchifolius]|uniref:Uncharacterized protein n=1 Tax=Smallanthus sonchifolius TaxID=185202 RepID=A0ACB9FYF0_9ASTR|nr:hypothetical protein L1987_45611 [Smallanthus sonchifolius]